MTELSGVDLARQTLVAAREVAKKRRRRTAPQTKKPKLRTVALTRPAPVSNGISGASWH